VLALWQRLNLRPLPHQQGSLALRAKAVIELVAMARPGYRSRPAVLSAVSAGLLDGFHAALVVPLIAAMAGATVTPAGLVRDRVGAADPDQAAAPGDPEMGRAAA
jgi:hypothetical protein